MHTKTPQTTTKITKQRVIAKRAIIGYKNGKIKTIYVEGKKQTKYGWTNKKEKHDTNSKMIDKSNYISNHIKHK